MDIRTILADHGLVEASSSSGFSTGTDFADVEQQLNNLDQYLKQSFRDGLIEEMEAKKIESYINTLNDYSQRIQERYDFVLNNESLKDGPVKQELLDAKAAYDSNYFDLLTTISAAIKDGVSTAEEGKQVDTQYRVLMDSTSRLERAMEAALYAIINERSTVAETNAKEYAASIMGQLAVDGLLSGAEREYVQDKIIAMVGFVVPATGDLPDMSTLEASKKGEIYSVRKQAVSVGIGVDDAAYNGLETAYNNLRTYLNTLSPRAWDTGSDVGVKVDKELWTDAWTGYYNALFDLKQAITEKLNGRVTETENKYDSDISDPENGLVTRMNNAESKISDGEIINTVVNSIEYQLSLDQKANSTDLADYASLADLTQATQELYDNFDAQIGGLDFSYVTASQLSQRADELSIQFRSSGGINLLKNSTGFAGLDFWSVTGTADTIQNAELDARGATSGFILNEGTLRQTFLVTSGIYTVSTLVKKGAEGSGYIKVSDDTQSFAVPFNAGTEYDYTKYSINISPTGNQITVELYGDAASGIIFTSNMANIGPEPLQWQHSPGELYNTNVLMDMNGVRVMSSVYKGYTAITPEEFAGYAEVDGQMTKIFTLNKEVTEMTKTHVDSEIAMGSIKILPINTATYNGWAFVPSDE
ncbi:hypothetical protein [Priestia megaterium]|uniref:hypothetical protein n=1 Tax=Priestia megaterium TaxID=1404 RepID=UPI000BFC50FE|nr:hypothetical protein [Priestia megaterium]PGQ88278.1 hypothetical protein COA18_04945 [Priestia megaterium]